MKSLRRKNSGVESNPNHRSPLQFERLIAGSRIVFDFLCHLDAKTRLGGSIMLAMIVFLSMPDWATFDLRILASWISGVLCFLTLVLLMILRATPQKTRGRAQRQEAHHLSVFLLVVITACTSILAIGLMQSNNQNVPETILAIEVAMELVAVVCSWFLTHTMFALHYATCYYCPDRETDTGYAGGLNFPGDDEPDYWDFLYFTFTLGMTAQTSDVTMPATQMRSIAIAHGAIAFFFYMVILASSVNVASGLL